MPLPDATTDRTGKVMQRSRIIERLSLVAVVGALIAAVAAFGHLPPQPNRPLHRALGLILARQALALSGAGGKILVLTRDTEAFPQPALDLLLKSFQAELQRSGHQAAVRCLQVDPLRPVEVPPGDLLELIRRGQPGQVLVSLLGPPLLSEEQWARVCPLKIKIVAFCPGPWTETVDFGRLFESGILQAAVVSRPFAPSADDSPKKAPTVDDLYLSLTAADVPKLRSLTLPAQ